MCVRLEHNGRIIIPGSKAPIIYRQGTQTLKKDMEWGVNLGYGLITNARIESVIDGKWKKHGLVQKGELIITAFFEQDHRFLFTHERPIGVIHNTSYFLVVTELATGKVRKVHHRQPCFTRLEQLKLAS